MNRNIDLSVEDFESLGKELEELLKDGLEGHPCEAFPDMHAEGNRNESKYWFSGVVVYSDGLYFEIHSKSLRKCVRNHKSIIKKIKAIYEASL